MFPPAYFFYFTTNIPTFHRPFMKLLKFIYQTFIPHSCACDGRLRHLPYTPQCASSRSVFCFTGKQFPVKQKNNWMPAALFVYLYIQFLILHQKSNAYWNYVEVNFYLFLCISMSLCMFPQLQSTDSK